MHLITFQTTLDLHTIENNLSLIRCPPTHTLLTRVAKSVHALGLHLNTVTSLRGGCVVSILDNRGVEEVLVQVVHVLENGELARDNDVVDCAQVLGVLGKTDTTGVRNDGHAKLLGYEEDGEDFVDTTHAAGVDLAHVDGASLEELLEDNSVLAHLSGGDANTVGLEGVADSLVAEDIVG